MGLLSKALRYRENRKGVDDEGDKKDSAGDSDLKLKSEDEKDLVNTGGSWNDDAGNHQIADDKSFEVIDQDDIKKAVSDNTAFTGDRGEITDGTLKLVESPIFNEEIKILDHVEYVTEHNTIEDKNGRIEGTAGITNKVHEAPGLEKTGGTGDPNPTAENVASQINRKIETMEKGTDSRADVKQGLNKKNINSDFAGIEKVSAYDSEADAIDDSFSEDVSGDELKFSDFMLLYEIQKEIARANTNDELYDAILFSLMGQIGASSSSIMVRSGNNVHKWVIVKSIGVTINNEDLYFNPSGGILKELFNRKKIIDIDEFKNNLELIDDYYKYISIDAKILVPLIQGYEIIGTVILGEKLDSGDYTDEDREFLNFVGEVSAIALNNINTMEMIMKVNENLSRDFGYIRDVDRFKKKIFSNMNLSRAETDLASEFDGMGITGYAVFVKNQDDKTFTPLFIDKIDNLKIRETGITFTEKSSFIKYMNKTEIPVVIFNPKESDLINEIFKVEQLLRISIFRIFPFIMGNNVYGFILVYKISESAVLDEIDKKLSRISEFLFTHTQNIQHFNIRQSNYIDTVEILFKRIEEEILNVKSLGIPLTIVMLSVKNYKRYYGLFGSSAYQKLVDGLESVIRRRISDSDFSIRYSRQKILLVLPGKDKKYAAPMANSIINEITGAFNSREIQLLITSLSAEYPADGNDLNSLIDIVDY